MLLFSYQCLTYLALPFFLLRLRAKRVQHQGYGAHWSQRFGHPSQALNQPIWIHGVSVGESIIACQIAQAIRLKHPKQAILITTHTPTGRDHVLKHAPTGVVHTYAPYDAPHCVKRFLRHIQPKQLILIETELWPNMIHYAAKATLPILVINARLSAPAYRRYRYLTPLFKRIMPKVTWVLAQSLTDAARYKRIGTPKSALKILGNIKADANPPKDCGAQGQAFKEAWGAQRLVCIGASTHESEEAFVLEAFMTLLKTHPNALLVLAPRHPNRAPHVASLCQAHDLKTALRTQMPSDLSTTQALVVDTLGELWSFYSASDLTFVGGTLIRLGGHNPLEPAKLAKPIASGPYVFNATDAYLALKKGGGGVVIRSADELGAHWQALADDPHQRQRMGEAAKASIAPMSGVKSKTMHCIEACFT